MEKPKPGLRRELKLWDLVPMQVVLIVGLSWCGFAAKQGATQVVLWLIAIVLFYLPLTAVVVKLSRSVPVEGGVYPWVKEGLSPFAGYMAGWCLAVNGVALYAATGSIFANGFAYAAGSWGSWMLTSKSFAFALHVLACLIAFVFNTRGLQLAKWLGTLGAVMVVATFLGMLYLLIKTLVISPFAKVSFSLAWPGLSILTMSVLAKMSIGALSGFEQASVFSEECRKPENDVARSVFIAAPLIGLMYILGTSATLAYVAPANVDLAASVSQLMRAGFGSTVVGSAFTAIGAASYNVAFLASMVITVGLVARLPMVAGWDGLLPAWWSDLHPRFRTPSKAIGVVTASMVVLGALSLIGAGNQEAVEGLLSVDVGSYCVMYMLLFAAILFGFRLRTDRPGVGIRLGALSAFSVASVALIFQVVPLGEVANPMVYGLKVGGAICATNGLGAYLYWRGTQRVQSVPSPVS